MAVVKHCVNVGAEALCVFAHVYEEAALVLLHQAIVVGVWITVKKCKQAILICPRLILITICLCGNLEML